MVCGIIAPRQSEVVGHQDDDYLAECILMRCHQGPHVIKTPEGRFIAWEDDYNCDCCQPEEFDRCIIWWSVLEKDILLF